MTEYNRTELGKKATERGFVIRTGTAEVQQMATKIKYRTGDTNNMNVDKV